jgi:hypothetical protein
VNKSSAPPEHPSTNDPDDTVEAHYASLEREPEACLCYDGWHFLGHVVELPDGDEVVEYDRVPCRRCASSAGDNLPGRGYPSGLRPFCLPVHCAKEGALC